MNYNIRKMNFHNAKEICNWIYPEPYSIYNLDDSDECLYELLNETYYSVLDEANHLLGYYCFGKAAQIPIAKDFGLYDDENLLDIGLGMNPNLCGQSLGYDFFKTGIEFATNQSSFKGFRLTVADFNHRAIKVYERIGFKEIGRFSRNFEILKMDFIVMVLNNSTK